MPPSKLARLSCIPGMLIFGTSTVVTQKIIFSMTAKNRNGDEAKFEKPWFQTEMMFAGMFLCLLVYEIQRLCERYKKTQIEKPNSKSRLSQYFLVMIPSICDMVATCMMNVGLVWISPSIWQMMRGSMIIFSTIFTIIFLKKKKYGYHFVSVILACCGLVIVAMASLRIPEVKKPGEKESSTSQKVVAIILVVAAQIVQASQIVLEEFFLNNIDMDASFIVGLEGLWGGIICGIALVPIGYTPESYGDYGFHEDTVDSFIMMGHNTKILYTIFLYIFFILCYNLFGMMVTQYFSAIYRTILEAVRTACIWVTNLIIFYGIDDNYGEQWVSWSFLQLTGFLFILFGSFLYNKVIMIPWFYYPDETLPAKPDIDGPLIVEEANN